MYLRRLVAWHWGGLCTKKSKEETVSCRKPPSTKRCQLVNSWQLGSDQNKSDVHFFISVSETWTFRNQVLPTALSFNRLSHIWNTISQYFSSSARDRLSFEETVTAVRPAHPLKSTSRPAPTFRITCVALRSQFYIPPCWESIVHNCTYYNSMLFGK